MSKYVAMVVLGAVPLLLAWAGANVEDVPCGAVQDKKPAEKATMADIESLVKELESNDASVRDKASGALLKIGEDALAALKAASREGEPVRGRAEALYDQIYAKLPMKTKVRKATRYGIDVLVLSMVLKGKKATGDDWNVLAEVAESLREEGKAKGSGINTGFSVRESYLPRPLEVVAEFKDGRVKGVSTSRLIAEKVVTKGAVVGSLVIGSGKLDAQLGINSSLLFVNGDVQCGAVSDSVVICDGNFGTGPALRSIVVARGKIKIQSVTTTRENVIEECYQQGFSSLRFFSIRDLGIQLAGGAGELEELVGVIRVDRGSILEKAGLRQADFISTVNGVKLDRVEDARKLFRQAVVEGVVEIQLNSGRMIKAIVP